MFQTTLDFLIWREHIESLYGKFNETIYVQAWNYGITEDLNFYNHYVYLPF